MPIFLQRKKKNLNLSSISPRTVSATRNQKPTETGLNRELQYVPFHALSDPLLPKKVYPHTFWPELIAYSS